MTETARSPRGRCAQFLLLGLIFVGCGIVAVFAIREGLRKAAMSEAVANMRSFKYALDTFAMDNDGVYPNVDTAGFYEIPVTHSSNQFFHQLYASGNTNSEKILWLPRSPVCGPTSPDDVTTTRGRWNPAETLKPGDNHWAYIADQTNVSHPESPLVLDPYIPGTTNFDRGLWGSKVLVVHIDSSCSPHDLDPSGALLDTYGNALLAPTHPLWRGTPPNLRQPNP